MLKRFNKIRKGLAGFKSELDWTPESWFGKRVAKPDGTKYTEDDVKALLSHLEEYNQIEKNAKANGTWLKMLDGSTWEGDPRAWVMMQSKAYKLNYAAKPWWTGQARWETELKTPDGVATDKVMRAPYHNGEMWFSDNYYYGDGFAHAVSRDGGTHRFKDSELDYDYKTDSYKLITPGKDAHITGVNFLAGIPKTGNYRRIEGPEEGKDNWLRMPFKLENELIIRLPKEQLKRNDRGWSNPEKVLTDDVVHWSRDLGDDGIFMDNVLDGPTMYQYFYDDGSIGLWDPNKTPINAYGRYLFPVNEFISLPGFTNKVKFIEGNNGNFDINDPYKYSDNRKHNPNLGRFGLKLKIPR